MVRKICVFGGDFYQTTFLKMHSISIKLIPLGEPPLSVPRPVERKLTEEPQVFKKTMTFLEHKITSTTSNDLECTGKNIYLLKPLDKFMIQYFH